MLIVVLAFAYFHLGAGVTLYGVVLGLRDQSTETALFTVTVDPATGNETRVATNVIYTGSSLAVTGLSTFDQDSSCLYFSTNFQGAFVYGTDTYNEVPLAPLSLGADRIVTIDYDGENGELLVGAYYADSDTTVVWGIPDDTTQAVYKLIDLTEVGLPNNIVDSALDDKVGRYYIAYENPSNGSYSIASFDTNNPKYIDTAEFACQKVGPNFIFYDTKLEQLLGVASVGGQYFYFSTYNGTCSLHPLPAGTIASADYDPTTHLLYASLLSSTANQIVTFNTAELGYTIARVRVGLKNVAVSLLA